MPTGTQNPSGFPAPDPAHNITAALALSPDEVIVAYQLGSGASTTQIMSNLKRLYQVVVAAGIAPRPAASVPIPGYATAVLASMLLVAGGVLARRSEGVYGMFKRLRTSASRGRPGTFR